MGRILPLLPAQATLLRLIFPALLLLAAWPALSGTTQAATTVRVLETWPAGDNVILGHNQNFYLRLAYETDTPAGIWLGAYHQGKRINAGSSPSPSRIGSGEALAWFFLFNPGDQVDEIRITAGDGSHGNTPVVAVWRGSVTGGSEPAAGDAPPAWVTEMTAQVQAAQEQAYRERMNTPVSTKETALFSGFMLAMLALALAGLVWPAWGVWNWQGGWRIAAAVPAVMVTFVVLRIIVGTALDPTSHNLWPFEVVMAGGVSLAAMALLQAARRYFGGGY